MHCTWQLRGTLPPLLLLLLLLLALLLLLVCQHRLQEGSHVSLGQTPGCSIR
jgi:hypothetical protein